MSPINLARFSDKWRLFGPPASGNLRAPSGSSGYTLSGASTVTQGTTATGDLTADGYTWAQGTPLEVASGKLIAWAMRVNGGSNRHVPVVSNDNGATWADAAVSGMTDAVGEGSLARIAQAWDATHSLLHTLAVGEQTTCGALYRAYTLTFDGGGNITTVTRTRAFQVEVGAANVVFEAPALIYLSDVDKLVASWSSHNTSTGKSELRGCIVPIVGGAADIDGANWDGLLGTSDTDTITSAFGTNVTYSCLAKANTGVALWGALCRKSSGAATHAKDLYWAYSISGSSLKFNRGAWSVGSSNFSGGLATAVVAGGGVAISSLVRAGTDTLGYAFKYQLVSALREDTANDKLWVGCSTYKSDTDGDTWTIWSIDGTEAVSSAIDVHVSGIANAASDSGRDAFITGDVMFDSTSGYVVAAFTNLPDHDAFLSTYSNGVAVQTNFSVYSATPCDIPTLYSARINNKIAILFRDFNPEFAANPPPDPTPPYDGFYVSVSLG